MRFEIGEKVCIKKEYLKKSFLQMQQLLTKMKDGN
jgi:hypothetical protein